MNKNSKYVIALTGPVSFALLASLAVGQNEPQVKPPQDERPAQANRSEDRAMISSLKQANDEFRNQVSQKVQQASTDGGHRIDVDQLAIASIRDQVIVAGAPMQSGGQVGIPANRSAGADGSSTDGGSKTGGTAAGASGTPRVKDAGGAQERDHGQDLGLVVIAMSMGDGGGASGIGQRRGDSSGHTGDKPERTDDENPPGADVPKPDAGSAGIARSQKLHSGVYKVQADGDFVKLMSDTVELRIPLVKIDKAHGLGVARGDATRRGSDGTSGGVAGAGSSTGATGTSGVGNAANADRSSTAMTTTPEWDVVFASIVCAVNERSGG